MTPLTNDELVRLGAYFQRIEETDLRDVRALAVGGGGMGVFRLVAALVDALALAYAGGKGNGATAWRGFVTKYLPEHGDLANEYSGFRSTGLHNLSAAPHIVFISGRRDAALHRTRTGGILHLHAERLVADIEAAFYRFRDETLLRDPDAGRCALAWFDQKPPVGPVRFYGGAAQSASAASSIATTAPLPVHVRGPRRRRWRGRRRGERRSSRDGV